MTLITFLLANLGNIVALALAAIKINEAIKKKDAQKVFEAIVELAPRQNAETNTQKHKDLLSAIQQALPREVKSIGGVEALSKAINQVYSTQVKPLEKISEKEQPDLSLGEIAKLLTGK